MDLVDDIGRPLSLPTVPRRIVSLVPSITEFVFALGAGASVVGATRFCVEPQAAREVPRVGGTKTPDLTAIRRAQPDLVLANAEENRREDVEALAAAGIPVYVTHPRTVRAGISLARQLGAIVGRTEAARVIAAPLERARADVVAAAAAGPHPRVFCPIWKEPWMGFNQDTFAHDMLATVGAGNVCAGFRDRYPVVTPSSLEGERLDLVLLPSEPYRFGDSDLDGVWRFLGVEPARRPPVRFIDGQALSWYGPRMDWGLRLLRDTVAGVTDRSVVG